MRDVMARFNSNRKVSPVTRPATYTDSDGVVHTVPAPRPVAAGSIVKHTGKRDECSPLCRCAECMAAGFTMQQRADAAMADADATMAEIASKPRPTKRSKLAQQARERVTMLRRNGVLLDPKRLPY